MAVLDASPVRAPEAVDQRSSSVGLRAVATFEAVKGTAVVLLGITLLLVHQQAEDYAESLLYHLHMDHDRRMSHMLIDAASKLSDARVWTIAAAALSYSSVRFIEAWGLWNRRVWAEWFALLSGAMYLPWELLKLAERVNWEHIGVLVLNLAIVLYMLWIRIRACNGSLNCKKTEELAYDKTPASSRALEL